MNLEALKAQPDAVREKVKEVSVDMWSGFTAVIKKLFPNAKIIYDRFHVMAIINDELIALIIEIFLPLFCGFLPRSLRPIKALA